MRSSLEDNDTTSTLEELAAEARLRYPVLTETEARWVAVLLCRFTGWEIWPMVGYPDSHVWYARQLLSSPPRVVRVNWLSELAGEIERRRGNGWAGA